MNAYDYPGDPEADRFIPEKWYLKDRINAAMEACEEARCLRAGAPYRRLEATYRAVSITFGSACGSCSSASPAPDAI